MIEDEEQSDTVDVDNDETNLREQVNALLKQCLKSSNPEDIEILSDGDEDMRVPKRQRSRDHGASGPHS